MDGLILKSLSDDQSRATKQKGFTLVEILVVVMLFALLSSAIILGVNAITSRQLHNQGERLLSWLQWAQQASMLSGSSYGIAEHNSELFVVAPLNGQWYRVVGLEQWRLSDEISWELPESGINNGSMFREIDIIEEPVQPTFAPFLVFSNVGLIDPVANITLISDADKLIIDWSTGVLAMVQP